MRKALGRGLDALIPLSSDEGPIAGAARRVPLDRIRPNHLQPRKHFDPERLTELAASIRAHGLAQPLLVSHDPATDTYELIAGERRLRAAELAGLREIDVVIRNPDSEQQRMVLALIENLQRQDLNPIEEALGYLRLIREFHISQSDLSQVVHKSKSAISNTLRLLDLPEEIQKAVEFGQLTEGHARALLMIADLTQRHKVFALVVERKLSVRETEDLARGSRAQDTLTKPRLKLDKPADIRAIEASLEQSLGTKVEIRTRKDPTKGTLTVHFFSLDEFDKIIKMIKK